MAIYTVCTTVVVRFAVTDPNPSRVLTTSTRKHHAVDKHAPCCR